ncbi:carboxypeptidase-like regulatory domain-containing protein [Mucilaginibacter mali]|uniref:Carboxypeptidase-like regulatory domain-containing protein n=1 Tax=Mucilaginibacter mali TaxID=2740462 RepID=A0A7D4TZQ8_9SPHI|nr:carboxypeptidase-like regulatory domain-containing protein [Mucilaginibacter mali]QKJ32437.1 carboxypeptidase-like regulatory domain-containing protein [Mucilaginibacter mali]
MAYKKHYISQIRKYLNGELDARAMHQLEREAQDDPFLMDAMEGYEQTTGPQQGQLNDLDALLEKRIGPSKVRRIIPWKYYAAAASVLLFLTIGYLRYGRQEAPVDKKTAALEKAPAPADHPLVNADTVAKTVADNKMLAATVPPAPANKPQAQLRQATVKADAEIRIDEPVGNSDVKAVTAYGYAKNDVKVKPNATLAELLKKMEGIEVDSNGNLTAKGRAVTKVRLNGKDYTGADVQQAVKNLPADIIEKAQVIDDYGDQAAKTGIKTGDPAKVLSIATRKQSKDSVALKEVVIPGLAKLSQKDIDKKASAPQTLKAKVEGAEVTTPKKISGTILSDLGLPLPGATVFIDGTKKGTQTDAQGHFSIPAEGQATLNVRSLGFQSKQVKARADDSVKVALQSEGASLAEVVIVNPNKAAVKEAHPQMGWDNYNKYLQRQAIGDKTGTVRLSFTVSSKGELSDFKVLNSFDTDEDKRAIDIVKTGPRWNGAAGGKTKTVKLNIEFSKRNEE